ncbi:MAG: HAD-IA family hydrolase [Methylocystaceae bacterium]
MIKHIVFDFDGTIADAKDVGYHIINELAGKHNYPKLTLEELSNINNYPIKERLKKIGVPLYKIPQLSLETLHIYRNLIQSVQAFDGMHDLLVNLQKEGFILSIISSNSVDNIKVFLHKHDLEFFDNIISVKNLFGKHVSIKKYLRQFRLRADEIIYIGDELRDIEACKKLRVKIISVVWGFDPLTLIKRGNPDYIAYQPNEILEIVKSITGA